MNKSKKRTLFRSAMVCTLASAMLLSGSCGKPNDKKGKIAVIAKQGGISFWNDVKSGAEDACEELGYEITYNVATSDNDYASQIEFINNAINDKVDAIVIAPNGDKELEEAFKKADEAGIKLININSRASYPGIITCVSSSDLDAGAVIARHATQKVLAEEEFRAVFSGGQANIEDAMRFGKGAVGIVGHTASTADERIEGFRTEVITQIISQMRKDGVNTDMDGKEGTIAQIAGAFQTFFIETNRCSSEDAAYEEAKKLLTSAEGANLRAIYATDTNTTLGVAKAVAELDRGKIFVLGFNSDPKEIEYLKSGIIDGLIIQNPYTIGYVGVSYAVKAIDDFNVPSALDTGVTYIEANNLNDDYIKLLLYPDSN